MLHLDAAVLFAQETAPSIPPVVLGLAASAFALLMIAGYLLFSELPRLKAALRSRDEEVSTLEARIEEDVQTAKQLAEEQAAATSVREQEHLKAVRQVEARVSELKADLASTDDAKRLASQLKDEQLATHVLRRCQRRLEDQAGELACAKAGDVATIAELRQRLANTQEQLHHQRQSAALDRHVQRRLQARLESESNEQLLDLEHVVMHARSLEKQVGFLAHTATIHRNRGAKMSRQLHTARCTERRLSASVNHHEAAGRARQRKIAALSEQLKQL